MQKISRKSLAVVALSVLLAISMALTFTFAALKDSETATGTITFAGGFTLTANSFGGTDPDYTFTIAPSYAPDGNVTFSIVENTANFAIATTDAQKLGVTLTLTKTSGNADLVTAKGFTSGTQYYLELNTQTATLELVDLLTLTGTTADAITDTSITYTLKIDVVVVSDQGELEALPTGIYEAA